MQNETRYTIGDRDERPWGFYCVTDTGTDSGGEGFCHKEITIKPLQILSLQSHRLRREKWNVMTGTLTAILDGQVQTLNPGQEIDIPVGAIHAMANLTKTACIVHEFQQGVCREDDSIRYGDLYGRSITADLRPAVQGSLGIYNDILMTLKEGG